DRRRDGNRAEHRPVHRAPGPGGAGPPAGGTVMNTSEDRVRQALRETAEDISPTDVPLLRLPDGPGRSRLARGWRGWPSWLTPLAAAAAVAAVLAATLALTGGPARPGHRTWSDALLARVPRYYVVLANTGANRGWPRQAEVRATRTGR